MHDTKFGTENANWNNYSDSHKEQHKFMHSLLCVHYKEKTLKLNIKLIKINYKATHFTKILFSVLEMANIEFDIQMSIDKSFNNKDFLYNLHEH